MSHKRYYDLLWGFGEKDDAEEAPSSIDTSPTAIIAVWRYRYPVTFSRAKQASFSKSASDITALRDEVLVIVEDVASVTVNSTKTNHISQMSATLKPGANYLTEIFPGDWAACWIVNSIAKANDLIARIRGGKACNGFDDGLKWMGRLAAPRVGLVQGARGARTSHYTINGGGFQEFDAGLYFEPYLASDSTGLASEWLQKTGLAIEQVMLRGDGGPNSQETVITATKAMPLFMDAFFGNGVPANQGFQDTPAGIPITKGLDNPNGFVIPAPVAAVLGVTTGTKSTGKVGWNDVCNLLYGVQKYQLGNSPQDSAFLVTSETEQGSSSATYSSAGQIFAPDGVSTDGSTRRLQCTDDLLGSFLPSAPQFDGQRTVWSVLEQYLNPAVNEMYTCLRAGPTGAVMPTLVVRQLPFTSGVLDETYRPRKIPPADLPKSAKAKKPKTPPLPNPIDAPRKLALTRFVEVPRWVVHPLLFKGGELGRSDSLRFNFIHVYGETGLADQNRAGYITRDPPIADDMDICRSGFRPYMSTVHCSPHDATSRRAGDWMYILSDILMGQHLTLTGTMQLVGIQSPICIGDNIEFDNHILHIEGLTHSYNVNSQTGIKTFRTNLALSHGLKIEQLDGSDFGMYSGTGPDDLRAYAGTTSRDYQVNPTEPSSPPAQGVTDAGDPNLDRIGETLGGVAEVFQSKAEGFAGIFKKDL
jgi:hypothetical protein